jgi:hypothetical protein
MRSVVFASGVAAFVAGGLFSFPAAAQFPPSGMIADFDDPSLATRYARDLPETGRSLRILSRWRYDCDKHGWVPMGNFRGFALPGPPRGAKEVVNDPDRAYNPRTQQRFIRERGERGVWIDLDTGERIIPPNLCPEPSGTAGPAPTNLEVARVIGGGNQSSTPPGKPAPASAAAGIYFGGLQLSFDVGSMSGRMGVTNQQQFTLCNPQQFTLCTPDRTPNAAADLTSSSPRGGISLEYLFGGMNIPGTNLPVLLGPKVLFGFGSSSSTISTIPGTFGDGGIATPAAAAHDSTTVRFGNSFGVLGEVGTILTVGNVPLYVAFDGGAGWQRTDLTFDCTVLGACGVNGIPAQSLTNSQTLSGSLLGGKVQAPLIALFPAANGGLLSGSSIGFQYLHGDYGNVSTILGTPAQIQITANQHVTTDSFMGTVSFKLVPTGPVRYPIAGGSTQRRFLP